MMRAVAITLRSLPEQAVLLDELFIALDSDKFQQVTAMLDAPVADNAGLARLKEVKAPWAGRDRERFMNEIRSFNIRRMMHNCT